MRLPDDFDPDWYTTSYPDVFASGMSAAEHYMRLGTLLGRPANGGYSFRNQPDAQSVLSGKKLLVVSHDASVTGAPAVLLHLLRWLKANEQWEVSTCLLAGGPLECDFKEVGAVQFSAGARGNDEAIRDLLARWRPDVALLNTVLSAPIALQLFTAGIPTAVWIHERLSTIREHGWSSKLEDALAYASYIVAAGPAVYTDILSFRENNPCRAKVTMLPEFVENTVAAPNSSPEVFQPPTIWCCGSLENRKGPDIAIKTAQALLEKGDSQHSIVWLGGSKDEVEHYTQMDREINGAAIIHFAGSYPRPWEKYRRGDIFFLPSRQDPFPLAALEAARQGLPIVCSAKSGSMHEFVLENRAGLVTDSADPTSFASLCRDLLMNRALCLEMGVNAERAVKRSYVTQAVAPLFANVLKETARIRPLMSTDTPTTVPKAGSAGPQSLAKVLVVSNGPPPVLRPGQNSEGGGLRCWGLAYGLKANLPSAEVALAFHACFAQSDDLKEAKGVSLISYDLTTLPALLGNYDVILVSFCMGDITEAVLACRKPGQFLVFDAYVPIHVEVSARRSANVQEEEAAYHSDILRWNRALLQADLLLCASTAQVTYYTGLLAGLGAISPKKYAEISSKLLRVPYGTFADIPRPLSKPCTETKPDARFHLLWFGAVYPWFDVDILLDAAQILNERIGAHLFMVGYANPFNNHPDFVGKANYVREAVTERGLEAFIHLRDWVPFEQRADWYMDSDLILTFNMEGIENALAWRTRLVDYVWSGAAVCTNGGDPLAEDLIAHEAASRVRTTTAEGLAHDLALLLESQDKLAQIRDNMHLYRDTLLWVNVVKPLAETICQATTPS